MMSGLQFSILISLLFVFVPKKTKKKIMFRKIKIKNKKYPIIYMESSVLSWVLSRLVFVHSMDITLKVYYGFTWLCWSIFSLAMLFESPYNLLCWLLLLSMKSLIPFNEKKKKGHFVRTDRKNSCLIQQELSAAFFFFLGNKEIKKRYKMSVRR